MNPARALLVDDDPTILEVVGTLLSRHGHEVVGTGSGLRGAQFLRGEHFDLAAVDLMLPALSRLGRHCSFVKVLGSYPNFEG